MIYEGCSEDYRSVLSKLFSHVSPENIAYISIGTFRFIPSLKSIIEKRFFESKTIYGEFIPGLDNKMRYFKPLRIDLYRKMVAWIRFNTVHKGPSRSSGTGKHLGRIP